MVVYVSINGVIRDFWTKFRQEYRKYYIETESSEEENFEYKINDVPSADIMERFSFQSEEEMKRFLYVETPMEICGHATPQYKNVMLDLNSYIKQQKDVDVCLISKEFSRSIPATLFFLSKTACTVNNISFYQNDSEINKLWEKCDIWITDEPKIIALKPVGKIVIKVLQDYNEEYVADKTIDSLKDLLIKDDETKIENETTITG